MQKRGLKRRTVVTLENKKNYNQFICKEGENDETPPYAVATLSVLFILLDKAWAILAMKMW